MVDLITAVSQIRFRSKKPSMVTQVRSAWVWNQQVLQVTSSCICVHMRVGGQTKIPVFFIQDFWPNQATIFIDFTSYLQSFMQFVRRSKNLIHGIISVYTILLSSGTSVCFVWKPSHVGFYGNELADRAIRTALQIRNDCQWDRWLSDGTSEWQIRWYQSTNGRYGIKKWVSREITWFNLINLCGPSSFDLQAVLAF